MTMESYTTTMPETDFLSPSAMYSEMNVTNVTSQLEPPYWTLGEQIGLSIVLIPIILVSTIGNAMVIIAVAYFKDMQRKTNVLIANLAVADFGVSLLCMPVSLITVIQGDWIFGDTFCAINGFFEAIFLFASIHALMHISIHKYFQLTKPLRRIVDKKWATVMIILTWLVAFTVAMAPVVGLTVNEYKPGTSQCGPKFPEGVTGVIHAGYSVLTGFVIPWTVMVICYTVIFRNITKHGQRMSQNSSMGQRRVFAQQKRITITLFVVFIIFFICWAPFIIFNIFGFTKGFDNIPIWPNAYVYWMGYLNSAINPVIYGWRNRSFKKAFYEIRHCCNTTSTFITEDGVMRTNSQRSRRTKRILYPPVTPSSPNKLPSNGRRFRFERQVSHLSLSSGSERRIRFQEDQNGSPLADLSSSPTRSILDIVQEEESDAHNATAHVNRAFDGESDTSSNADIEIDTNTAADEHTNPVFDGKLDELADDESKNEIDIAAKTPDIPPSNADGDIDGTNLPETNTTEIAAQNPDDTFPITATNASSCDDVQNARENVVDDSQNASNNQNKQVIQVTEDSNRRKSSLTKLSENLMSALSTVTASLSDDTDNKILLSADAIDETSEEQDP